MQSTQRTLLVGALALAFAASPAAATWYSAGTYEPDTSYDEVDGRMWPGPDSTADVSLRRVYFSAYPTNAYTDANPNAGALGTRLTSTPTTYWQAFLGVWKDCNADGYIGMAESALHEYRSELADVGVVCPASTDPLAHNDGTWVHEYIPLGPTDAPWDFYPGQQADTPIFAMDARVWGDAGLPWDAPAGGVCVGAPLPHGTTSGTGALVRHVDCFTGRAIVNTVNALDPDDQLGLRFDDPRNPQQSDSLLNQHLPVSLFGNPTTGQPGLLQLDSERDAGEEKRAFTVWDCSQREVDEQDPTGTTDGVWVARLAPEVHDPTSSYADAANHTARGMSLTGDCSATGPNAYGDVHATATYYADAPVESTGQVVLKTETDVGFSFFDGVPTGDWISFGGLVDQDEVRGAVREVFGERAGNNLGLGVGGLHRNYAPGWSSDFIFVEAPTLADRNALAALPAEHWTFYASLDTSAAGLAGLTLPAGGAAYIYGEERCGSPGPGAPGMNGWACDPDLWYRDPAGADTSQPWDVRVGHEYQLRDIDCFDQRLARAGGPVPAELSASTRPCSDASG